MQPGILEEYWWPPDLPSYHAAENELDLAARHEATSPPDKVRLKFKRLRAPAHVCLADIIECRVDIHEHSTGRLPLPHLPLLSAVHETATAPYQTAFYGCRTSRRVGLGPSFAPRGRQSAFRWEAMLGQLADDVQDHPVDADLGVVRLSWVGRLPPSSTSLGGDRGGCTHL